MNEVDREIIKLAGKFLRDWLKANPNANNDVIKHRLEYYVEISADLVNTVRNLD